MISSHWGSFYPSRPQYSELLITCSRDEVEEIKAHLSSVKAEMRSLNERYDALSASYVNLHEKFDFIQNEVSVYQSTMKLPPPVQNHDIFQSENVSYAEMPAGLVRVVSIDSNSKVKG